MNLHIEQIEIGSGKTKQKFLLHFRGMDNDRKVITASASGRGAERHVLRTGDTMPIYFQEDVEEEDDGGSKMTFTVTEGPNGELTVREKGEDKAASEDTMLFGESHRVNPRSLSSHKGRTPARPTGRERARQDLALLDMTTPRKLTDDEVIRMLLMPERAITPVMRDSLIMTLSGETSEPAGGVPSVSASPAGGGRPSLYQRCARTLSELIGRRGA